MSELVKFQEGDTWYQEDGQSLPAGRATKYEQFCEKSTKQIHKKVVSMHEKLRELKQYIADMCEKAYAKFREEYGAEEDTHPNKSFAYYNFDRSVKVMMDIRSRTIFDEDKVQLAQEKFNKFIESIPGEGEVEVLKGIIHDAFEKRNGKFDAVKLDRLFRHKDKTKNEDFHEAIRLLYNAKHHMPQNIYYRVFHKVPLYEEGVEVEGKFEYEQIDLQFSSINLLKEENHGSGN